MSDPGRGPTVLILDDHHSWAQALALAISVLRPRWPSPIVAASVDDALTIISSQLVDVMLLEWSLPGTDGIRVSRLVADRAPGVRVVLVSGSASAGLAAIARQAGIIDVLPKSAQLTEVIAATEAAVDEHGTRWRWNDVDHLELTPQQVEVLRRVGEGQDVAAIAEGMFLGTETVRTYLKHIYRRLGVHGRADAVRAARRRGLIPPERTP